MDDDQSFGLRFDPQARFNPERIKIQTLRRNDMLGALNYGSYSVLEDLWH